MGNIDSSRWSQALMFCGTFVHLCAPNTWTGLSASTMVPVRSPPLVKTVSTSPWPMLTVPVPLDWTPAPALTLLPVPEGKRVRVVPSSEPTTW